MENQDKKTRPEGERKPDASHAEGNRGNRGEGGGHNRHGRSRHRNRNRGEAKRNPEAAAAQTESNAEAREAREPREARPAREGGHAPSNGEGGEGRSRNRNRNRNRNRAKERTEEAVTPRETEGAPATAEPEKKQTPPRRTDDYVFVPVEPAPEAQTAKAEAPKPELPRYTVVGIRFREGGKIYYFDPGTFDCPDNSHVIVETARGLEFGIVALSNREVSQREIVLPLRKVIRFATPEDERRHEDNLEKETEAYNACLSRIEAHRLDMKLVDVEYAFDNSKLLFCYTAEERVDFRELVKDLASLFHTRIEMRQIGIRDEAKLMGGLGVCGRPFCCKSFLPDFVQVSIKMAKEQNLSLNSAKISGACGRLMCCLRYEYDTYLEEAALTPKVDAIVDTPDGEGLVVESSPLKGTVKVTLNKEPNGARLYRREDCVVKGHMKKKKNGGDGDKKNEEKK